MKRTSIWRSSFRWFVLISVIGVLSGAVFIVYQHKTQSQLYVTVNNYAIRVLTWMAERKHHLHDGLVKVKQLAVVKNDAEQEIHFEFYTALPSMQVSVPEPVVNEVKDVVVRKLSPAKSIAASKPVVSVDEIEKELETQINKKHL